MNKQIEELFNKVEWQDEIINRQIIKINDLQEKIDRAIEYIENTDNICIKNFIKEQLLEILGDKE